MTNDDIKNNNINVKEIYLNSSKPENKSIVL